MLFAHGVTILVGNTVDVVVVVLHLRCLQVALSGRCKGNPEEIKQIFLTEAVQVNDLRGEIVQHALFVTCCFFSRYRKLYPRGA